MPSYYTFGLRDLDMKVENDIIFKNREICKRTHIAKEGRKERRKEKWP